MGVLILPPALRRQIVIHTRALRPREACGVLLGRSADGSTRVEGVLPAPNVAADPRTRYSIDVAELFAAHRTARDESRDVVGYFHSHPGGPAVPSRTDRESAWAGMRQLIVGWAGSEPELRCWVFDPHPEEEGVRAC
jgi:proteasome lid subunit RPN8/RPN11